MKKHDWRLDFVKIIAIIMVLYNHLYCYSFIFSYNVKGNRDYTLFIAYTEFTM